MTSLMWTILGFVRRETLVHFAIAGGLLFLLDAIRAPPDQEVIHVTREIANDLARARQELTGVPLSGSERSTVVAGYISDEILLREAYARSLYRRDGLVRKRLLELMRFMLIEEPAEPTTSELQSYLASHRDVYQPPPSVSFSHVYFSGEEGAAALDAERVLARLDAGADFRKLGDRFWLGHRLEGYVEPQLVQLFGFDFARNVLRLPPGRWAGPITSTRGIHFVRIDEHRRSEMPAFVDLVPSLRVDWIASKREELLQRKVDELRGKYRVEMDSGVDR